MKKILLLLSFIFISSFCFAQIATGVNNLQAFPWRTFSNSNMVGLVFDGSQYRMYGFDKYALLDTTNTTGRFATKYDVSLKLSPSRTITINGTSYDLSTNRTWTVGDILSSGSYSNPSWISSLPWSKITGTPTVYSFSGNTSQYTRGDGTYAIFPTAVSSFTNDANYVTGSSMSTALSTKENTISAGTVLQYYRGDKTWQALNSSAVGLANVDNTSDLSKPISTATQTALNNKFTLPSGTEAQYIRGDGSLSTFPTTISSFTNDANYVTSSSLSSTLGGYATTTALSSGLATKQNTLSLTTTGSGAATLVGSTLNIPTPVVNTYTAGTGINIASNVITNTAPDQTVSITSGTGISITGTYPSFTATNTAPYVVPTVNSVTRTLNSNFTISTTKQAQVAYTVSLSVTNPLLVGTSSAAAYLEYSTNAGSTWVAVSDALVSSSVGVTVTVAITNTQSQIVSGVIPANALVRLRTLTSGTASIVYIRGQETY